MKIVPVILSGGVGTRLWPLSRAAAPKQLQTLFGDRSMIQATALRASGIADVAPPIVVCGTRHADAITSQLAEAGIPPGLVIAEPAGRNTAPAIALAALMAPSDAALLVLPADHVVRDVGAFAGVVEAALPAVESGSLVTFGIVPTAPETGYGYIRVGEGSEVIRPVAGFVEKPDRRTAEGYLASGRYLWNSGMFAFRADVGVGELRRHAPEVLAAVEASLAGEGASLAGVEQQTAPVLPGDAFLDAPSISFDYAVMERTDRAVVIPMDAGWSDVGSWATLWELGEKDPAGNAVSGDVVLVDSSGSFVRGSQRLIALVGVDDLVVVDTGDALLVAARDRVQDVKRVVDLLSGRPEVDEPG